MIWRQVAKLVEQAQSVSELREGEVNKVIDVDAHVHEPVDWVAHVDKRLAEALGPPATFLEVSDSVFGVGNPAVRQLPEKQHPDSRYDTILPGFKRHLEMTDERQAESQAEIAGDPFCNAEARIQHCDEKGIDVQFLNPSFLVGPIVQAVRTKQHHLIPDIRRSWNTWAMDLVHGHADRLIPVTQINLADIDGSIAEMTRMRTLGSRAFAIPESPVATGRSTPAKSLTHPDFDPVWAAAVDLGMAAIAHVGFGRERINFGWANNGGEDLATYSFLNSVVAPQVAPQLLLAAMVFDGLFERFPKLTVVVEEVGISWLPHLLAVLDHGVGQSTHAALIDGEFRPDFAGAAYKYPLKPSEYLRRQVRVTPLVANEPLRPTLEMAPEMLCFSSDYPHVEGTADALAICERQLSDLPDSARSAFYGGVGDMIGL